jgi:hypothetical protein
MSTKKTTSKKTSASKPKKAITTRQKRAAKRNAPDRSTSRLADEKKGATSSRSPKKEVVDRLLELLRQIKELQAEYDQLRADGTAGEAQEDQVGSGANEE